MNLTSDVKIKDIGPWNIAADASVLVCGYHATAWSPREGMSTVVNRGETKVHNSFYNVFWHNQPTMTMETLKN